MQHNPDIPFEEALDNRAKKNVLERRKLWQNQTEGRWLRSTKTGMRGKSREESKD